MGMEGVLSQVHGKGFVEELAHVGRIKTGTKGGALVGKQVQVGEKTQALHSYCSCWVTGKRPHPGNPGTQRCLKHVAGKER